MMINNKYLYDKDNNIIGVKGEKTIRIGTIKDCIILITRQPKDSNGEKYYNFYIIDPLFKEEPTNNLNQQIPVEQKIDDWNKFIEQQFIQYYIWREFNKNVEKLVYEKDTKCCFNCGYEITEKNKKNHYPINSTIFCKVNKKCQS